MLSKAGCATCWGTGKCESAMTSGSENFMDRTSACVRVFQQTPSSGVVKVLRQLTRSALGTMIIAVCGDVSGAVPMRLMQVPFQRRDATPLPRHTAIKLIEDRESSFRSGVRSICDISNNFLSSAI
jgi:hypothetical protein